MRIAAVSDLHGHLPSIPECEILLIGGDICPLLDHSVLFQSRWLDTEFRNWLENVPAKRIVGTSGNHDWVFDRAPHLVPAGLPWTYLQDDGDEALGLKVWGSPWQPRFYDWAFNLDADDRKRKWSLIPDDTNVLVLHGPPLWYGDLVARRVRDDEVADPSGGSRVGCPHLRERIAQLPDLRLAIFGHIHSGYGMYRMGDKVLANVSLVNERHEAVNPVMVFDIE